jgi:acyl dehydratase
MSGQKLTFENAASLVGKELGVSSWHVVDQNMINQFAACTGDHQWIHVDVERANRESPFGGPVAHGFLSLALIAPLSMEVGVVPEGALAAFNYGIDKVRFLAPVKAGSKVRLKVTLMDFAPRDDEQAVIKTNNTLEIEGAAKPALVAETLAMVTAARPFR